MRLLTSAAVAVAARVGVVMAQITDPTQLPSCASSCLTEMENKFADFGCSSTVDYGCLCLAQSFKDGITNCGTQACASEDPEGANELVTYVNQKCATATGGIPSSTSTAPEPTAPAAESTSAPTSSAAPETTSTSDLAGVATTSAASTPTTLLTSTKAPAPTSDDISTSDSNSGTKTADADADPASATASGSSSGDDEGDEDDGDSTSGISTGAKIGIAVGSGAAAVIFLSLLIALCCRRRDRKASAKRNEKEFDISSPMPGSGRSYASDDGGSNPVVTPTTSKIKGRKQNLELTSTRYENMVPRTQPSLTQVRS
ncbi:hypothetical protein MKZ38_010260 [Zalerion maritima]|uniref:CFEM domain-containing protein n=1 Tax=Zalerion maritima TaxID=339359 RepID=A0AAD5RUD7_9PEZI|nr:hypothetical protein MKZ38_010260 [Zalerion maritima]